MNAVELYKLRQELLALAARYKGKHQAEFQDLIRKLYQENVEMVMA